MFTVKKSILFVSALIMAVSCGKIQSNEEIEPNNTVSTATIVETGKEYTGFLDTENDIDNYLLKIPEDQVIRIELSGVKGINHAIQVRGIVDGSLRAIKTVDDNRKSSPEEIANLFLNPGDYIIVVTHGIRDVKKGNSENSYTLRITARSPFNEESEPNDLPEYGNIIGNGESIAGYFSPSRNMLNENSQWPYREEDWFSADIVAGDDAPVTVDLFLKGVGGVDSILSLYSPEMKELAVSDNTSAGGAESITGFGIKSTGRYYILVTSKSFQYNHREPYELSMNLNLHDSGSELEPNNGFDNAGRITGNSVSGRINQPGDQDFFFYNENPGSNIRIRLQNDPGLDGVVTVFGSGRVKLLEANNSGSGNDEIIPAFSVKDGVFIRVSSVQPSVSEMPYRLIVEQIIIDGKHEKEPNNSIKEANTLKDEISGFTSSKNDRDYFLIKPEARARYRINASAPKNGTVRLSTTDQMGYIIKTKTLSNGETISINELFDKKGYLIIETVTPDFENQYNINISGAE
ncbi:MAG TPA: hypothetical protein PK906_06360 [Spirochaetota bacterium]|nr:hypothetical protein [Spirochaetota bacterium]